MVALAAAWGLQKVPLPGVDRAALSWFHGRATFGATKLWLIPLANGFLLTELLSFLPPARRWRHGGVEGRARLGRVALAWCLVLAVVQAAVLATLLEPMTNGYGEPLVPEPGLRFRLLAVVTMIGGTAALYGLGWVISQRGIGNGFCWLGLLGTAQYEVQGWRAKAGDPTEILFGTLWMVPVVAFLVWFLRRGPGVATTAAVGGTVKTRLPELPQGVVPVTAAVWAVAGARRVVARLHLLHVAGPPLLFSVIGTAVLIPALSALGFLFFGNARRVAANLSPAAAVDPAVRAILRRQLARTTAYLIAAELALALVVHFIPAAPVLSLGLLAAFVAFALDLRDELRFLRRHGRRAHVLQLDNVHLASFLAALLSARGIDTLPRAHRYRGLSYFLDPLVKIDLLVPADRAAEAGEILATQELRVV